MAQYDIVPAWFHTPRGHTVLVYVREGTNEYNTAQATLSEDEYGLADLAIEGHAIDIGGHLGTVTLGLLVDHPTLTATVVEPLPVNCEIIERNLAANGVLDRATIVCGAAGFPETGTQTIHYGFRGTEQAEHHAFVGNISLLGGYGSLGCNDHLPHEHIDAPIVSLASLAKPTTSFLKIDCEGAEWKVLADPAAVWLPRIHGELHPIDNHKMAEIDTLLPFHVVTRLGDYAEAGPCEFRAVLR